MNLRQLEHLLRASADILGEDKLVVIGSQSILGKYPDAPADLLFSMEADIFARGRRATSRKLDAIGEGSDFHETFGYYVDPVDESTAILPKDWKSRLVNLTTYSVALRREITGLCLDPHDLFVSKVAAGREKDVRFVTSMLAHGMVSVERAMELARTVVSPADDLGLVARILSRIERLSAHSIVEGTVTVNETWGRYTGAIVGLAEGEVWQEIGRGVKKCHQAAKLSCIPAFGRICTIQYKNGLGVVIEQDEGGRDA